MLVHEVEPAGRGHQTVLRRSCSGHYVDMHEYMPDCILNWLNAASCCLESKVPSKVRIDGCDNAQFTGTCDSLLQHPLARSDYWGEED